MTPIIIPPTTPHCYLSFNRALNLRVAGELTGDWHFKVAFFCDPFGPRKVASLAGIGQPIDTTPVLQDFGVRDMAAILREKRIIIDSGPIHVANHFRAIADLSFYDCWKGRLPGVATAETVHQWLDTNDQVGHLISFYLEPLRDLLSGASCRQLDDLVAGIRG